MKTEITIAVGLGILAIGGLVVVWTAPSDQPNLILANEVTEHTSDSQPFHGKDFTMLNKEELHEKLTPLQYKVTQKDGTEPPFKNEYWDNKEPGIYVDVVSGEPLFSSKSKYKSGTGWPSFYEPLEKANIVEHENSSFWSVRTEVRSKQANSHLGHVFPDGPAPTGLRYCLNSAALRFVPVSKLQEEGYEQYAKLFEADVSEEKQ